ncbi:zinc knuckle CX2CX4HX4C containing protein [Tanacetum coccineum]
MNDMKNVKEDYSQNSISNEDIEQNKVNEEMVGQGVKGGCMENESEISTEKDGYDRENEIVSDERNSKKNEDGVKEIHENNEAQNKNRYGFRDIVDSNNGIFFIKFNNDEGIEYVMNNGPWLVKNKPLIVQKWDINMRLDKTEPEVISLWIKLCNEAWTNKDISALASRIDKPIKMDVVTASMCKMGVGRFGYSRVLIEVSARKPLHYVIDVVYKNGAKEFICKKIVKVVYDWKPPCCNNCCVFGHFDYQCRKNKINTRKEERGKNVDVKRRNEDTTRKNEVMRKVIMKGSFLSNIKEKLNDNRIPIRAEKIPQKKAWSVHGEILSAMKRSANKYSVLDLYDETEIIELQEIKNKERMEEGIRKEVDDVFNDMSGIAEYMENDGVNGILLDPFQFSYPKRNLTMEEIVNKFIEKGKREHEEMGAFIREFRTTNELLLKDRNNSLSELEFEVYGLSRAINKAQMVGCEAKGLSVGNQDKRKLCKVFSAIWELVDTVKKTLELGARGVE